jgi:hypothetical protein
MGLSAEEQAELKEDQQSQIERDHEARRKRLGHDQPAQNPSAAPEPGMHESDVAEREAKTARGIPDFKGNPPEPQSASSEESQDADPTQSGSDSGDQETPPPESSPDETSYESYSDSSTENS